MAQLKEVKLTGNQARQLWHVLSEDGALDEITIREEAGVTSYVISVGGHGAYDEGVLTDEEVD